MQKKDQQRAENEGAAGGKKKKVTAAQLRVQKGMCHPCLRMDQAGVALVSSVLAHGR